MEFTYFSDIIVRTQTLSQQEIRSTAKVLLFSCTEQEDPNIKDLLTNNFTYS